MVSSSLFSSFDPTMSIGSLSWLTFLLIPIILPSLNQKNSLSLNYLMICMNFFIKEINYSMEKIFKGGVIFISSAFFMTAMMNFMALFPFIFSLSSHLAVNMPNSLILWSTIMLFAWTYYMSNFLSHLIPSGTPIFLMSFMVLVEMLSNFIRPVALTFRLTANMMAGHLLMSLIGGVSVSLSFTFMTFMAMVQSLLVVMELGVSIIQAYVFSTLLMLYMSE